MHWQIKAEQDLSIQTIDFGFLKSLEPYSDGATSLAIAVLEIYFEKAPQQIQDIQSALAQQNLAAVQTIAHNLKSSSANIGAFLVAELCRNIELYDASQSDAHQSVQALVLSLQGDFARTFADLQRLYPLIQEHHNAKNAA